MLLPEEEGLCDKRGKLISGGLFGVSRKEHSDRVINDRRPFNRNERRLVWAKLPHGTLLTQLVLSGELSIRASGDDLKIFFCLLKHREEWLPRNVVGKAVSGKFFTEFGASPSRKYVLAFRVVCMGDVNGVDICQQTHVEILRDAGVMRPEHVLEYNSPLPFEHTLEGLYIDDHVVLQIGPKKKFRKGASDPNFSLDEELIARSRQQYAKLGLPVSADKAFTKLRKFKVWGTEVDSASGRVGTPLEKLRQLCQVTCSVLKLRRISKKCLEQLVGWFIHPFMHRRLCMSVFGEYTLLETWPSRGRKALPKSLVEEFVGACLILPLCHTNIRWPVSQRLSSTDASLSGAGRCATRTSPSVSRLLHRAAEHVGERVRLDWGTKGIAPLTDMRRPSQHLERLTSVHKWVVTESKPFKVRRHINLLELEVLHREYLDVASRVKGGLRAVNLTDSRVVLGAVAKGRSSSRSCGSAWLSAWLVVKLSTTCGCQLIITPLITRPASKPCLRLHS